jgi:hypothetical protein
MSGTRLSRGSLESSCVACRQTYLSCGKAVSGSFHPCNLATTAAVAQGLSRESGWKEGTATPRSSFNRHIKCANGRRRRHLLQIVQQAASPTLNSPENVATKNLQVSPLPGVCICRSLFAFLYPWVGSAVQFPQQQTRTPSRKGQV